GSVAPAEPFVVGIVAAAAGFDAAVPFREGHLVLAHGQGVCDFDLDLRLLELQDMVPALAQLIDGLALRAADDEATRGKDHDVGAPVAVAELAVSLEPVETEHRLPVLADLECDEDRVRDESHREAGRIEGAPVPAVGRKDVDAVRDGSPGAAADPELARGARGDPFDRRGRRLVSDRADDLLGRDPGPPHEAAVGTAADPFGRKFGGY